MQQEQLRGLRDTLAQNEFDQRKQTERTRVALPQRIPRYISKCRTCSLVTGKAEDYMLVCEHLGQVIMPLKERWGI